MTLFNPIASFFEWLLQIYNLMPLAIKNLINLSFAIVLSLAVIGIFYKVKH